MTLDLNDLQRRNGADPDWRDIRDGAARLEDVTDENSRYEAEVLLEYEAAHLREQRVLGQFLRIPELLDTTRWVPSCRRSASRTPSTRA